MDLLAQITTLKILRVALRKLPDNMASAYDKTLERVNSQGKYDRELAYRIFGWIAFMRRPLTVLELRHALAVELGTMILDPDNLCSEDLLESVCGGLVISVDQIWPTGTFLRFVHYTTQEYFMSQKDILFPQFQKTITSTCLTYMSLDFERSYHNNGDDNSSNNSDNDNNNNTSNSKNNSNKRCIQVHVGSATSSVKYLSSACKYPREYHNLKPPFLCYSLDYWRYHASELQHSMVDEIIAFLDSVCCGKITKICCDKIVSTEAPVALHFAVQYDLLHITEVLLDRGDDPCQCETPLLVTAINSGNLEMVKLLLDRKEIDPNTRNSKKQQTPLSYAVEREFTQIVEILLQSNQVDVNCKDSTGRTPLSYAAGRG
ncbi:hypothetical protein EV421DRAFT_1144381, partial [Armillaria borealis]